MIEIVEANPGWADEFIEVAQNIRAIVGDAALRIDHIGSTSVPELAAKDVIDIQITVESLENQTVVDLLVSKGYRHIERIGTDLLVGFPKGSPELKKLVMKEPMGSRVTNIHVRELGRVNQIYPLLFRDYLRANPSVRDAYGEIKLQLASRFKDDIDAYYDIKDPYMDTVYYGAKSWAELVGWNVEDECM